MIAHTHAHVHTPLHHLLESLVCQTLNMCMENNTLLKEYGCVTLRPSTCYSMCDRSETEACPPYSRNLASVPGTLAEPEPVCFLVKIAGRITRPVSSLQSCHPTSPMDISLGTTLYCTPPYKREGEAPQGNISWRVHKSFWLNHS